MMAMWRKLSGLIRNGVPNVWVVDPETLQSELWTASGVQRVADKSLRVPNSPIVIPLLDVAKD